MRVLILGGTGEARELAARLRAAGADVLSSLAGRTRQPRLPDGAVHTGGFGGPGGLAAFLRHEAITHLIDATHPFAEVITANAALAADDAGVPRLVLRQPAWQPDPLRDHGIGLLVTKNSGGPMPAAKLQAARDLGVEVVMVRRPPLPPGSRVAATIPEVLNWISDGHWR